MLTVIDFVSLVQSSMLSRVQGTKSPIPYRRNIKSFWALLSDDPWASGTGFVLLISFVSRQCMVTFSLHLDRLGNYLIVFIYCKNNHQTYKYKDEYLGGSGIDIHSSISPTRWLKLSKFWKYKEKFICTDTNAIFVCPKPSSLDKHTQARILGQLSFMEW